MKKKIMIFVISVSLIISLCPAALADDGGGFTDISGHWAEKNITAAEVAGWVNGYPDDTFKPDNPITRAEFVKMLMAAIHLTPGSSSAALLSSIDNGYIGTLNINFQNSWLQTQGWTNTALAFGLIVPSDYNGGNFEPNKPITRYEIVVMADRALGLVYPASTDTSAPAYKDASQMPTWVKGYVDMATNAGVMTGLPDGTFGGSRTATRAEAVTVALRVLNNMETGIDRNIKVFVKNYVKGTTQPVSLTVPAQMIGGRVFVPALDLYNAAMQLYESATVPGHVTGVGWDTFHQILSFEYGVSLLFQPNNVYYGIMTVIGSGGPLPTAPRLLYGDLMVPVYNPDQPSSFGILWFNQNWDAAAKTLTVCINEPQHLIS